MVWLALGIGGLALGLWLLRLFSAAPVESIRKVVVWLLAAAGGGLLLLLVLSGRAGQAIWTLALFGPLLWRTWQALRTSRAFSRPAGNGGESMVETATLVMGLDHETGQMHGQVRRGAHAGRDLGSLSVADLLDLLAECRLSDPESLPLLETWLDRLSPDWRDASPGAAAPPAAMDRAEALAVLGLEEGADAAAIRAAHRRLMRSAHPDHGGSDWLAARVNQARDILLAGQPPG